MEIPGGWTPRSNVSTLVVIAAAIEFPKWNLYRIFSNSSSDFACIATSVCYFRPVSDFAWRVCIPSATPEDSR
jgi:hypothetical protein